VCCLCLCNFRNSALVLTLQNFVNLCNQRPPEGIRMHQICFAMHWESSRRSPIPLVGWGGGKPPPHTSPLDAFGVSVPAPSAPVALPPTYFSFPRAWKWLTVTCSCRRNVRSPCQVRAVKDMKHLPSKPVDVLRTRCMGTAAARNWRRPEAVTSHVRQGVGPCRHGMVY